MACVPRKSDQVAFLNLEFPWRELCIHIVAPALGLLQTPNLFHNRRKRCQVPIDHFVTRHGTLIQCFSIAIKIGSDPADMAVFHS